jgi:hypothetical protein
MNIEMTEKSMHIARSWDDGFCINCGNRNLHIEPDAKERKCNDCGQFKVFGIGSLLEMDKIEFVDDE